MSEREHTAGPLLAVRELRVRYERRGREALEALRGVSFELAAGEVLAVVGASGSGKSTLARALVGLVPCAGEVLLAGSSGELAAASVVQRRRALQLVFQDPGASLDPRQRVGEALDEVLRHVRGLEPASARSGECERLMTMVGLSPELLGAAPRQLSGGQRQRVAIARALALEPRVLVCDEVLSALDATVQARVLELLRELVSSRGLALLFITHDLAVARRIADRVAVMQAGEMVESGPAATVFERARHAHTRELWAARPRWPS